MNHPKTVFLILPKSDRAVEFLTENTGPESQWYNDGLAVEHRFIFELLEGMKDAGLNDDDYEVM